MQIAYFRVPFVCKTASPEIRTMCYVSFVMLLAGAVGQPHGPTRARSEEEYAGEEDVTLVVPAYNMTEYLERCVESLIASKRNDDIEKC